MSDIKVYTKAAMAAELAKAGPNFSNPVALAETVIGGRYKTLSQGALYDKAFGKVRRLGPSGVDYSSMAQYGGAIHVPMKWADGKTGSVFERVSASRNSASPMAAFTGNTLIPDWNQLWDAMRMDITVRKNALPVMRGMFYNIYNRPDADKSNKLTEMLPYAIVFDEYNGTGQPVRQGDKGEGKVGNVDIKIYAAGFMWDLLAEMFDKSLDLTALNDAVAVGYNAKQDALAFAPILAGTYAGAATTAAVATSGLGREELLHKTLVNAIDGLAKRKDPVTGREIDPSGVVMLCSGNVARHAQRVVNGLPQNTGNTPLGAISEISAIVAYDGDTIVNRDGDTVYSGVGDTYAYLVKKNRYLDIIVKQGLTTEIDMNPDVKTLAREERAYYFAEGLYSAEGVANFIQRVTLPAWV